MIKLIIFDFDGVIITGSNDGYIKSYHHALESVGVNLEPEEERRRILAHWGKGHVPQLEYLLHETPEKVDDAVKAWEEYFRNNFRQNLKFITGAKETIEQLSGKYKLAVISGAHKKMLLEMIEEGNINYFSDVISSYDFDDLAKRKPAPYAINMLVEKYGLSKDEILSIGDDRTDVEMARSAGVTPIVVMTGNLRQEEAEELRVVHILESITELPKLLKQV